MAPDSLSLQETPQWVFLPILCYYFRWQGDTQAGGSGAIALGLVSLCNHAFEPKVRPNYDDSTLGLYAAIDIAAGEEITICYCSLWFEPAPS